VYKQVFFCEIRTNLVVREEIMLSGAATVATDSNSSSK